MATNGAPQEGDQIETLEEAIDFLLKIMAASISYLSRKAPHIQTNPDVPLSVLPQAAKDALVDEETMVESAEELVQDLMIKAKQVEKLIKDLPEWSAANGEQLAQVRLKQVQPLSARTDLYPCGSQNGELQAVQTEMLVANKEYREAVEEARAFF